MATKEKTYKFSSKMGTCADQLYKIREEKKKAKKVVDDIEKKEKALKAHIIDNLPKSEASGIAGKIGRVTIKVTPTPQVEDWPSFYKYVVRTKGFDMLQRRLSVAAVNERLDDGKKVAGVKNFNVVSVSLTKA